MNVKPGFDMIKETFKGWQEDGALDLGAALAYYAIFSLAPLLLIVIGVAGLVWGREAVQGQLVGQLQGIVGEQGGQAIQTMIANAGKHGSGVAATIIGLVTILFGATGVFVQLQNALDRIWNVEPKPGAGIWGFVKTRMLSFGMILGIGFLLLISLVVATAVTAVSTWATGLMPAAKVLTEGLAFVVSFALTTLLFAMIFRFLPDVKITWRDVWIGAAATALLFTLGKFLIGLYLAKSSVASTYGAAGSLVVVLLWIYYSSQILFLGAEFTQVYASHYGSNIRPSKHAVPVVRKTEVASAREWPPTKEKEKEKGAPERPPKNSSPDNRKAGGA
jgi:membrane protein